MAPELVVPLTETHPSVNLNVHSSMSIEIPSNAHCTIHGRLIDQKSPCPSTYIASFLWSQEGALNPKRGHFYSAVRISFGRPMSLMSWLARPSNGEADSPVFAATSAGDVTLRKIGSFVMGVGMSRSHCPPSYTSSGFNRSHQ